MSTTLISKKLRKKWRAFQLGLLELAFHHVFAALNLRNLDGPTAIAAEGISVQKRRMIQIEQVIVQQHVTTWNMEVVPARILKRRISQQNLTVIRNQTRIGKSGIPRPHPQPHPILDDGIGLQTATRRNGFLRWDARA
jgi:hypothetical protein